MTQLEHTKSDKGYLFYEESRRIYTKSEKEKVPVRVRVNKIVGCIIAQSYKESAYFAGKGLPILYYTIHSDGKLKGPLNMKDVNRRDWELFIND